MMPGAVLTERSQDRRPMLSAVATRMQIDKCRVVISRATFDGLCFNNWIIVGLLYPPKQRMNDLLATEAANCGGLLIYFSAPQTWRR